jgi:hypothetical protein
MFLLSHRPLLKPSIVIGRQLNCVIVDTSSDVHQSAQQDDLSEQTDLYPPCRWEQKRFDRKETPKNGYHR